MALESDYLGGRVAALHAIVSYWAERLAACEPYPALPNEAMIAALTRDMDTARSLAAGLPR